MSQLSSLCVLLVLFSVLACCYSDSFYFAGSGSTDFSVLGNWRIGAIDGDVAVSLPTSGDDIFIITDNAATVSFGLTTALQTFGSVTIGSASETSSNTQKLILSTSFAAANEIKVQGKGVLEITDSATVSGDGKIVVEGGGSCEQKGDVENDNNIEVNSDSEYKWTSGTITGSGEVLVKAGGRLLIEGEETGRSIGSKTMKVSGTLRSTASESIETNSQILVQASGHLDWSGSGSLTTSSSGNLLVQSGGSADVSGATTIAVEVTNEGEMRFQQSKILINKAYTQVEASAHTVIASTANVTYESSSELQFSAGNVSLAGSLRSDNGVRIGSTNAKAVLKGRLAAESRKRDTPERSTVYGNLVVESNSFLEIDAASSENYDRFNVLGQARYEQDSGIYFSLQGGFIPREGDEYTIITHTSRDGGFDRFIAFGVFGADVLYSPTRTRVRVTSSIAGAGSSVQASIIGAIVMITAAFFTM